MNTKRYYLHQTKKEDIIGPSASPSPCSIHHWASHGIAGRAILLDYWSYANANTTSGASYDPYTTHPITLSDLHSCAKAQGISLLPVSEGGDIKTGDILLVRSGFVDKYNHLSPAERKRAALRNSHDLQWAGLSQDEDLRDWLHDSYFAAVAGDSPTFEAWPPAGGRYLHQSILALWGMPLGEMWDLEELARRCREMGRWVVFLTSAPANVHGMLPSFSMWLG